MTPPSYRARLALLLLAGLGIRAGIAFATHGLVFDLQSYVLTEHALRSHPLHVYDLVNSPTLYRWPYLSGFFPLLLLTRVATSVTGLTFTALIRLPAVLADLGLAWVVQDFLGRRGASAQRRLAAAGVIALGPMFIANSGFDGQFDSLAILPAVLAVALWDRLPTGRRAVAAGALIGAGCALKSFPLIMVLALVPTCESARERVLLLAVAIGVPLVAIAPWLAVDPHGVSAAVRYHSLAGTGGLGLFAQPDLAAIWLGGPPVHLTGISRVLQGTLGTLITAVPTALAAVALLRRRVPGLDAAILLWLTVFVFSVNFAPRYVVWAVPFFVMAGRLWRSLLVQAILIVPTVLLRAAPFSSHRVLLVYVPAMALAWLLFAMWGAACWQRVAAGFTRPLAAGPGYARDGW